MRADVLALQRFYASPLGEVAHRMIARRIGAVWPHADGLDVMGLGYCTPFLEPYRAGARRVTALMPAAQGAERWPAEHRTLSALGDETRLPFLDSIFDRVLLVHALEEAEAPRALLREVWRVMAPEGRLIVVAANRAGLWSLSTGTPFGYGRPFARSQLGALLREALFEPAASARALFAPPLDWKPVTGMAEPLERVGEFIVPALGGVVLMEAVKRLYADAAGAPRRVVLAKAPMRARPAGASPARPAPLPLPGEAA